MTSQYCKYTNSQHAPFHAKSDFEITFNVKYNKKYEPYSERGFVIGYMAYTDPCEFYLFKKYVKRLILFS